MTDSSYISLLDLVARWNRWGSNPLESGFSRDVVTSVAPFFHTPEAITFVGPRRAGKTTVMFQVMDALARDGVPPQAMLHLDLEEPAFSVDLGTGLLDRAWDAWRRSVHPEGRAYVFLDEVQRVAGWERWARAAMEREHAKIFVTGSSSAVLSREAGTLLTGRHVSFRVFPLGFSEFLRFRGIPIPHGPGPSPRMEGALLEYMRWGSFPEVVLAQNDARRSALLKQYLDDILFKDVALRHGVRDLATLRNMAIHLLTQTANLMSHQRLARTFGVSLDMARAYVSFLQEAYLVECLPFMSLKATERQRNPWKVHAVDTGLRNVLTLAGTPDLGRVAETLVQAAVRRTEPDGMSWWKGKGEVDLLVQRGGDPTDAIQVTWSEDGAIPAREVASLQEVSLAFPGVRRTLVVGPGGGHVDDEDIACVPLWRFLAGA